MLFIFDENFPHTFVKAFSLLEKSNRHSNLSVDVVFSVDFMGGPILDSSGNQLSITDIDIIKKAKAQEAVIITHDSDFKRIKQYKPLLIENQVGYIYFKTPKGKYLYWDIVTVFINKWEKIKSEVAQSDHPFAFEIDKKGNLGKLSF